MIKVGCCVAYDWQYLKYSLPRVYEWADKICLAVDRDRHSWTCTPFEFDATSFYQFVKEIDTQNKIDIYEDDFSLDQLNARGNGNRHRSLIAERMGKGGWHLQVDSDEYFLDFKSFVAELKSIHPNPKGNEKPINVCGIWIPVIKKTDEGYLYVTFGEEIGETVPIATNVPDYQRARHNGHFNHLTNNLIVHETWARGEADLLFKISNWGHSAEELEEKQKRLSYFNLWKSLDQHNCEYVHNFHPASPSTWPWLKFMQADTMDELIEKFRSQIPTVPKWKLTMNNNRNLARIKSIIKK